MSERVLSLSINGDLRRLISADERTLLEVLREDLDLTGTKHGCEVGECGACTVLVDGRPRLSCLTPTVMVEGCEITTVEGLARGAVQHPLQEAFSERSAAQCGYCTPGMLMSAKALLDADPSPTTDAVRDALAGNLCRCTGYNKIIEAVQIAGKRLAAP